MTPLDEFLGHYPAPLRGIAHPHLASDAFSGARLWRLETSAGPYCVRAWPKDGMTGPQLDFIHALLRRAAPLDFVPRLIPTRAGATWVHLDERYWELTTWLPGRADFHTAPSIPRLQAACSALARLHLAWATPGECICPAVQRRLAALGQWQRLVAHGWRPSWPDNDPITPWARRAWLLVQEHVADVPRRLAPWLTQRVPVQPCLCDLWHAHVLYTGDAVTGLIDYGSVKLDHVAVDLARLLGSLASADTALWQAGLEAYAARWSLSDAERALVADLDATGTVIALTNWLRWLYHEGRPYADRSTVAGRVAALVTRLAALSGKTADKL